MAATAAAALRIAAATVDAFTAFQQSPSVFRASTCPGWPSPERLTTIAVTGWTRPRTRGQA